VQKSLLHAEYDPPPPTWSISRVNNLGPALWTFYLRVGRSLRQSLAESTAQEGRNNTCLMASFTLHIPLALYCGIFIVSSKAPFCWCVCPSRHVTHHHHPGVTCWSSPILYLVIMCIGTGSSPVRIGGCFVRKHAKRPKNKCRFCNSFTWLIYNLQRRKIYTMLYTNLQCTVQ
jgi:hypothetical protein